MSIRFKHGGREWEVDSPDEAIALRQKLEMRDAVAVETGEDVDWIPERIWTPDKIADFTEQLGPQQWRLLLLLFDESVVSSSEIKTRIRLGSETALAGILGGLSKRLGKLSLRPSALYSVEVRWTGKDKTRTFRLSPDFRWTAESELGWPEALPPMAANLHKTIMRPKRIESGK